MRARSLRLSSLELPVRDKGLRGREINCYTPSSLGVYTKEKDIQTERKQKKRKILQFFSLANYPLYLLIADGL